MSKNGNFTTTRRILPIIWGAFILATLLVISASAQGPTPTAEEVNVIARELWCPLCNGVRLDTCELRACEQMRETIRDKLAAGESKEAIKAYFVEKYGQIVLGEPPRQGIHWLPWVLPFAALLAGALYIFYLGRTWTARPRPTGSSVETRLTPGRLPTRRGTEPEDEYWQRVEEELKRYEK